MFSREGYNGSKFFCSVVFGHFSQKKNIFMISNSKHKFRNRRGKMGAFMVANCKYLILKYCSIRWINRNQKLKPKYFLFV